MPVMETTGTVRPDGTVTFDEPLMLPPGPAHFTIRTRENGQGTSVLPPLTEEEIVRRRAGLATLWGTASDDDAQELMRIIEEEFEQVDPNEWR